ncbi:MAG: Crp/Fnr family transcriptional regulator [Chloroflexi bacterium]|nr:Crp/Fnr family transcriptional regulator [Chloroflexota bacterium]MCI0577843.1 Crp/Fnr family transcriptional regulator [Chloroflexota bacterium]MCI0646140.1 Crp/Fnr family transcriptional regulator [Chloroflexota bacterium]
MADSKATLELLAKAPLFGGLPLAALEATLRAAHHRRVQRQEFFFHQDEPATTFYVLLDGRARLTQLTPEGHQVIIRVVGPGDGIGIIVALSNVPYPLSAEAITDCLALAWDSQAVIQLMEQYPRLALNGMRLVAHRFHELQNSYRELATERVERRVARALLRLARQTGKRTEQGVLLDLPLSRQDLGEMTGTTLYTVSRILSAWEQAGLIEAGRERVTIRNPHGLVVIAEDLPENN